MFALVMISLLLFLRRREAQYIHYVLATLSLTMLVATMQGYSLLYLFDADPWITPRLSYLCIASFLLFSNCFTISFLNIATFDIRLYRVGHVLNGFCVLLIVWALTVPDPAQSMFCYYASVFIGGYIVFAAGFALKERVPGAMEFLAANVLLVTSAALAAFPFAEGPESALFSFVVEFGTAAQALLLSVALVAKSNGIIDRCRESAEADSIDKGEFLASMSREIRTAINGVVRVLDLLLLSELSSEQRNRAFIAHFCSKSLLVLVNNILDLSKIEAGKVAIKGAEFNLHETLRKAVGSMEEVARDKDLKLTLDISHIKQPNVIGDSLRLFQVVSNLVSNAVKFTHSGEVLISAYLVPAENVGMVFTCRVRDTGIGIAPDQQALLLDYSKPKSTPTTRKYGGTQLSLSIARELTQLMGGSLSLTSKPDQGSAFEISLLFQSSEQQPKEQRL
jgi:signal transduction histidine kinase